ncbi:MAG: hypothetical protein OEZ22_10070 [Spirochaetia bacterium]|nr:hypothetical protein [Spirochaetia bacterium]
MPANEYKYRPDVNYVLIAEGNSDKVIKHLDVFKKGYLFPLESHILNADGLRKYLNSAAVTPDIRADFRFQVKEIENSLLNIVRFYSSIESSLQEKSIDDLAHKDYYTYFNNQPIENNKIEFVKMLKIYEILKTFNNNIINEWNFCKGIFEAIKINSLNKLFLEQVLVFKIYPRIELCEQTDFLLRRMAYILKIKSEEIKNDKVTAEGEYTSLIKYGISSLYRTDLTELIDESHLKIKKETEKPKVEEKETCIVDPFLLDSRGEMSFNTSYLYILNIDKERYELEEEKIKKTVYIETHLGAEETALRKDLIRNFISHKKKQNKPMEYINFLNKFFEFTKNSMLIHLHEFSEKEKLTYMYHFGPIYFLKLTMFFMREGKTGFIHRTLKKQKMVRELPFEFLKYNLKTWWDDEIYSHTKSSERNSVDFFNKITNLSKKMWFEDQVKVISKIKNDPVLLRAFHTRDHKLLKPIIETQISYLFYIILLRFLGQDFIYLKNSSQSERNVIYS